MFLISQNCTHQINTIKYELQGIQQQRMDIMQESTSVLESYGQDSPQYQAALAQANALDSQLEVRQNELEVSLQMLNSWRESEEDDTKNTNDRIMKGMG